jgi:hypothetical protein
MKTSLLAALVLFTFSLAHAASSLQEKISCEVTLNKNAVTVNGEATYPSEVIMTLEGVRTTDAGLTHIVTSKDNGNMLAFVNMAEGSTVMGLYDRKSGLMADLQMGALKEGVKLTLTSSSKVSVLDDASNLSLVLSCK